MWCYRERAYSLSVLIHPNAWKRCSPKFVSRMLHRASWKVRNEPVRDITSVEADHNI